MRWTDEQIWDLAIELGLDPFPTEFHTVPANVLLDVASRGISGRYTHWSHGQAFAMHKARHDWHMGRIYEVVLNSNPSLAFLLDVNSDVINLLIKCHVLGHTDFFKHNIAFQGTDRRMPTRAALRAERIRGYEERYGLAAVEQTLDDLLTVEWLVDPDGYDGAVKPDDPQHRGEYDDFLNAGKAVAETPQISYNDRKRFSGLPCRDVLAFLIAEAPLDDWQRDIANIVREDGLYFWPQIRTKTVNEGWASFWHIRMMRQLGLTDGEYTEFAKVNAGVVSAHPGQLNPYWLGLKMLEDIDKRLGRDKLFEIRRLSTDTAFIRNYLTKDLIEDLNLVRYGFKGDHAIVTEDNWEKVRDGIANDMAGRFPEIVVVDKDYDGTGALLLRHEHDGRDLKQTSAIKVLNHLQRLWRRPVVLETARQSTGRARIHSPPIHSPEFQPLKGDALNVDSQSAG